MTNADDNIDAVIPLESNPVVFTEYAEKLGLSPILSFTDIYSLSDPDLLAFLPRPIQAIVLLFPISEGYETLRREEERLRTSTLLQLEDITSEMNPSNNIAEKLYETDHNTFWLKQVIKNACGLYALLHVLLNLPTGLIVKNSVVSNLKDSLINCDNADVSKLVKEIGRSMNTEYAQKGQSEAPDAGDDIDLHFLCFVKTDAGIVELDGRRNGPVVLQANPNDNEDIIDSTIMIKRIEKYMSLAEGENSLKFAMMGLAPSLD